MARERISLYDTTLRDGAQTHGVDFSVEDKWLIAQQLDALGLDYIEARLSRRQPDRHAAVRRGAAARPRQAHRVRHDQAAGPLDRQRSGLPGAARRQCRRRSASSPRRWDFHVDVALGISLEENLAGIKESTEAVVASGREALLDCEHFFDGYKANPDYALACAKTAYEAGARWVVLCDTNGGTLPEEIETIVTEVVEAHPRRPSRHPCA